MNFDHPKDTAATEVWHAATAPEAQAQDHDAPASASTPALGSGIVAATSELFQGLFDEIGPSSLAAGVGGVGGGRIKPVSKPQKPGQQPQRDPGKGGDGKDKDEDKSGDKGIKIPGQRDEFVPSKEPKPGLPKLKREGLFGAPPAEEVAKARTESGLATLMLLLTLAAPEVMIPAELAMLLLGSTTGGRASGVGPATVPPQML